MAAAPARQINVVTASGTNAFHGGAYEFFRNNIFNANNYFNKLTSPYTPVAAAALQRLRLQGGRPGRHSASLQRQGQDILLLLAGVPAGGHIRDARRPTCRPRRRRAGNFTNSYTDRLPARRHCRPSARSASQRHVLRTPTTGDQRPTSRRRRKPISRMFTTRFRLADTAPSDIAAGLDPHTVDQQHPQHLQ